MSILFAVIRNAPDGSAITLCICRSRKAAVAAAQSEKDKVPVHERAGITAVCMDDGGYTEIPI